MVPEGWTGVALGDVAEVRLGATPARRVADYWATNGQPGHPWVAISDLSDSKWISETAEKITDKGVQNSSVKLVEPGHTLVSFKLSLGKVARVGVPLYTNEAIAALVPKDGKVDDDFLYYAVPSLVEAATSTVQAVKGRTLNKGKLQRLCLLLPPLPEQRKIAAILSSVDDAIAATRKVIEQTKRLGQGLLQSLLSRGIGHAQFKNTEIGEIPEEWDVVSLADVCIGKGSYGASARKSDYSPELPRYLRITDINDDGTLNDSDPASLPEKAANGNLVEVGDFLFARSGATVGKTYRVTGLEGRAAYAGYLIRFKPDPSKLEPAFLDAFTHSPRYWRWVADTRRAMAQPNINAGEYGSMPVPLPPLGEQKEIVGVYLRIGELQDHYRRSVVRLEGLKRGLMQDLLTGRVRVQPD